jgi:5-oxoprolinase (ATP-hydrolysing) subunit A
VLQAADGLERRCNAADARLTVAAFIDLNSDVGEGFASWPGGPDVELMEVITSANVACGFHAGDPSILRATCALAAERDVAIGAQVSYPDLLGFGRRFIDMRPDELTDAVIYQIGALQAFAKVAGTTVRYVKPHGALYNTIVHHEAQAAAVVRAVVEYDAELPLMGLPNSVVEREAASAGLRFVREGFVDRGYTPQGTLIPRGTPGALLTDVDSVVAQARLLVGQQVESLCTHSDTPGAATLAAAVAMALRSDGLTVRPFVNG